MADKKKITDELINFENLEKEQRDLQDKLNEFILLLNESKLDSENVKDLKHRINTAIDEKLREKQLKGVRKLVTAEMDKLDQLDQLELMLKTSHFDSRDLRPAKFTQVLYRGIKAIIGLLFVTLGFAMIIMPAPPYFEMFTIFHFTRDDGVTLMDLISLIIVAVGIYIIFKSLFNLKQNE